MLGTPGEVGGGESLGHVRWSGVMGYLNLKEMEVEKRREVCVCVKIYECHGWLFIIRVKREVKRVYRNGCRYNERLNTETGGSKTPHTHWVPWVNI